MKMNGAHGTGAGLGAIAAIVIVALGKRAGITLTQEEAISVFALLTGIGLGIGHGVHALLKVGIVPAWRHLWWGPASSAK